MGNSKIQLSSKIGAVIDGLKPADEAGICSGGYQQQHANRCRLVPLAERPLCSRQGL